jgi:starch-binding outer membrane protein, SusD/RagB family
MTTSSGSMRRMWACMKVAALTLILGAVACDTLLEVDLPGRIEADRLEDPRLVPVLLTGTLSDFECAFQGYAVTSSVLTKEFIGASTARATNIWLARLVAVNETSGTTGCTGIGGAYRPLHTARFQGEDLFARIQRFPDGSVPNRSEALATAAAYAAYSSALLGEGFCEMAMDGGPLMSREDVFRHAETWFTNALEHAPQAAPASIRNMALVGRARVRLNLGDHAGAIADASLVPEGFVRLIQTSRAASRRENRFFVRNTETLELPVAPLYRDLEVDGVPDIRVPVAASGGVGADGVTPHWFLLKYPSHTSPLVLAGWREAQLIIAEASGGGEAVSAINRLRASVDLPLFESTDPEEIRLQVLEERRRELAFEGHRLGDMLRNSLPFPEGATHKGEPFGPITCIPLPNVEREVNQNL